MCTGDSDRMPVHSLHCYMYLTAYTHTLFASLHASSACASIFCPSLYEFIEKNFISKTYILFIVDYMTYLLSLYMLL